MLTVVLNAEEGEGVYYPRHCSPSQPTVAGAIYTEKRDRGT